MCPLMWKRLATGSRVLSLLPNRTRFLNTAITYAAVVAPLVFTDAKTSWREAVEPSGRRYWLLHRVREHPDN
jgi:hypothetical protein